MAASHSSRNGSTRVSPRLRASTDQRTEPPTDEPAVDSLVEAFEACDGYELLSEALKPAGDDEPEPLQFTTNR